VRGLKSDNTYNIGRQLEDEVADIYRNMDSVKKVIPNFSIMGIQVDVYVEIESNDGILNRYSIDAKNFANNVSSEHARKCITDFQVLRSSNKIDRGIIVARKGFTKDANAAVIEAGFIPLLIADLKKRALDFSSYLNSWIKTYEHEILPHMVKYISITAQKPDKTSVGNLDKYLVDWLKNSGNHITLLGNYGTGKSTTLRYLMNLQAKKYLEHSETERIPIFIELKGFRQAPKSRQLITDILVNDFSLNINYRKFQEMNEKGRFLIILDGFDEMADRVLDGLPYEHFEELSAFACENSKVILSSRTHYFKDHEQLLEVHTQVSDLYSRVESRNGFELLFLNSFTKKIFMIT
jgi:predicted NACHT family NTPase